MADAVVGERADLGMVLEYLWWDERCSWHIDFDGSAGSSEPWTVILEWTQEYNNPHQADWVTYTWQFYGATVDEALADAIAWCEGLVPFERCGACDGDGEYTSGSTVVACEDCGGTGLANPTPSAG